MKASPDFKKADRYKLDSFRTYNFKMPLRYDSSIYHRVFNTLLWDRIIASELAPNLPSLRILDVGCATGRLLCNLARAGAQNLYGMDLAPRILDVARDKFRSGGIVVELRSGDAEEKIPWSENSFDAVTLTGVLHHFSRPADVLDEIWRVLAAPGRILIAEPLFISPLRQLVNLYLWVLPHAGDYRFYSPDVVGRLIAKTGWREVRYRKIGWNSYLVSGMKL